MSRDEPQLNVRIPQELLAKLKELAAREGRSITQQVLFIIRKAVKKS